MVPLREIMEKLGAEVQWEGDIKMIRITIEEVTREISQESPAIIIKGRTYLPLKNLTELFEYNLDWDNYTKSAWITN